MGVQNQIKRALSKPEAIEYVGQLLADEDAFLTRTELAEVICEEFGFQDPRGQNQLGGCLKGLRELEAKGWFQLPRPEIQKGGPAPRRLSEPVAKPQAVPAEVGGVGALELILVEQEIQMRIWNELMSVGAKTCAILAGRKAPVVWLRYGRLQARCRGFTFMRACPLKASLLGRGRICL
jgi:hypothetical protein